MTTFRIYNDLIDVTSLHRADTSWRFVDAAGHEHRWYTNGEPATRYNPESKYVVPTLIWIKDGEEYWEGDDEPHPVGHLECRQCGEHIRPQYTADDCQQYIRGLTYYYVDGRRVTQELYKQEFEKWLQERGER